MRKMIVYISGPISNIDDDNEPLFREWEQKLQAMGYDTIVPHDLDPLCAKPTWHDWMRACLRKLPDADIVVTLPNWEYSKGAPIEVNTARSIDIPIIHCVVMKSADKMIWPSRAVFRSLEEAA